MYSHTSQVRVRYGETDQMGYVYYGNYALYYETGRVEMLRSLGMSYRSMEEQGVMLPVLSLNCKYILPAKYDDLLTIKTTLVAQPNVRISFEYEIYNEEQLLVNKGDTTLVFVSSTTGKPMQAPKWFLDTLKDRI
ncbi:MAG: acyl-CoA thioesterase [Bacteroidia bacterium]|nr:acyl-CoA thioesterase [Bacteroidia bacterium]